MQEKTMKANRDVQKLEKRYQRLAARLAKLGPIVQGTITERTITKTDPDDPDRSKTIGPYYQWTFKRNAKTVTVNLSPTQAKIFKRAIENNRKLKAIIQEMRSISRTLLEATTEGVKKRKTRR
jgi:hypothetical protein